MIAEFAGLTVRRINQLAQEGVIKAKSVAGQKDRQFDFLPTARALLGYYVYSR